MRKTVMTGANETTYAGTIAFIISAIGVWYLSRTQFLIIIESYKSLAIMLLISVPLLILVFALHAGDVGGKGRGLRAMVIILYGILLYGIMPEEMMEGVSNGAITVWVVLLGLAIVFDKSIHEMVKKKKAANSVVITTPTTP